MGTLRLSFLIFVAACVSHCGGTPRSPSAEDEGSLPGDCGSSPGSGCTPERDEPLGSSWHPDPDGDGIPNHVDVCPHIYDVEQGDADGDGIGDSCDDDSAPAARKGAVVDLKAQHVTPYGGWFGFTSPRTTRYGQDYAVAWSTDASDLSSGTSIRKLPAVQRAVIRVFEYEGSPIVRPHIITAMEPGTTYFVAVAPLNDRDQPTSPVGNVTRITTHAAPTLRLASSSPRVMVRAEQLEVLRARHDKGDKSVSTWTNVMGGSVIDAARSGTEHDFGECVSAALLFHGTGDATYRKAALTLIEAMRVYWSNNVLENNQLRWANANLGICADLMWQELEGSQRNAIVAAFLDDDEAASVERNVDTDEFASIARTWIIDGLVGCGAEGLSPALSERACALLERGKRAFYGVQLVKARRNRGFFAQSGGNLPDGIGYGMGTSTYWLMTFIALGNSGASLESYAPWIWNNLKAMQIHALTPGKKGLATFGDLDSYDNFDVEPNSHPLLDYNGGLIAMHMGLLEQAGYTTQASRARWHLDSLYPKQDFGGNWAMLLFAHDGIEAREDDSALSTAFYDEGMGMLFDRTHWGKDASFLTFRAGWSGADHTHEDAGAFQLYRAGEWISNEDLGYDGPSATAAGHNVPALEIDFDDGRRRVGQFHLDAERNAQIDRIATRDDYTYVKADLLGAYTSGRHHSFRYQDVTRQLLWLKPSKNNSDDRLFILDRIVGTESKVHGRRGWQLHLNTKPTVAGNRASLETRSHVEVDLLLPKGSSLRYEAPQGSHSQYPGERYTGRLLADAKPTANRVQFLSVLRASGTPINSKALAIEGDRLVGALVDTDLVLFSETADAPQELFVPLAGASPTRVIWAGLEPGSAYAVHVVRRDQGIALTLSIGGKGRADEAGVLSRPL